MTSSPAPKGSFAKGLAMILIGVGVVVAVSFGFAAVKEDKEYQPGDPTPVVSIPGTGRG